MMYHIEYTFVPKIYSSKLKQFEAMTNTHIPQTKLLGVKFQ